MLHSRLPRSMERYNPFASSSLVAEDDLDPFGTGLPQEAPPPQPPPPPPPLSHQPASRSDSLGNRYASVQANRAPAKATTPVNRYSTNFPDPFDELAGSSAGRGEQQKSATPDDLHLSNTRLTGSNRGNINMTSNNSPIGNNRSSSINFAPVSARSVDDPSTVIAPGPLTRNSAAGRQASGFSSFLSRATSVTSSSVTDRVSEAVGSVRSAVDSLSSQIQQAVPTNINERLTTTASSLINSATGESVQQQSIQQQQSAASYLASKISSATGQFTSSGPSSNSLPVISRQRVILMIDSFASADWAQQFNNYRRLLSGTSSSSQSAITSFFSSATAQLTTSSSANLEGDLIEQVDFRDVSVLANQATSTATILINDQNPASRSSSSAKTSVSSSMMNSAAPRIVRPEYVVVRQRTKEQSDHLRAIVSALNYCAVPMFEPMETWNVFQNRQSVFAKLLRVQKQLGRENFPLIPQVYCQTHQDLLNYINSSSVLLPCLTRTGPFGKGKIRMDNLQMLKDFASIMATSGLSCTIERFLEVKCDLVVQKMGTSMKLFKKTVPSINESGSNLIGTDERTASLNANDNLIRQSFERQSASRQTSIGSSVLSSLISTTTGNMNQQLSRQGSNPAAASYEKLSDVNVRYRKWIEGIMREFDNKLEVFCIKIAVASDDREYIVGLNDCSIDFLGNQENQEEDKRSFVELIISNMNIVLPNTHQTDLQSPANLQSGSIKQGGSEMMKQASCGSSTGLQSLSMRQPIDSPLGDKKKFISQTQINGSYGATSGPTSMRSSQASHRNYGQLSSRSQSVSMNQSDYLIDETPINKTAFFARRGSDRSDSLTTTEAEDLSTSQDSQSQVTVSSSAANIHQRQTSMGQSIFDQTSTAFNSFQKQSLSFFKRLDARSGTDLISSTPPQSAKSDRGFERTFVSNKSDDSTSASNTRNGFKSQSMDGSTLERSGSMRESSMHRRTPPKPPPPPSMSFRQSSLVSHSAHREVSNSTPHSTPNRTRQNSSSTDTNPSSASDGSGQRGKIVRQNSALSAFERLESELAASSTTLDRTNETSLSGSRANQAGNPSLVPDKPQKPFDLTKKSVNFDSASITSGDSNSTAETTTAEDTMNNLKKTFASIFGDKCE